MALLRWVDRGVQNGASHFTGYTSQRLLDEDFHVCSSEGLSDYEIAAIPIETYVSCRSGNRIPSESCSICLEGLNDGDRIKQLPLCKHSFHPECIDPWLHRRCISFPLRLRRQADCVPFVQCDMSLVPALHLRAKDGTEKDQRGEDFPGIPNLKTFSPCCRYPISRMPTDALSLCESCFRHKYMC